MTVKSTTRCAGTLILLLEHGRIVERGTHHTLLTQGGAYAQLYDVQLRDQEEFEAQALASRGRRTQRGEGRGDPVHTEGRRVAR